MCCLNFWVSGCKALIISTLHQQHTLTRDCKVLRQSVLCEIRTLFDML